MSYPEHEPYHVRSVDAQILDALLRIEEMLKAFLVLLPVQDARGNYEDRVTPETKPTLAVKNPALGTLAKGRRK